MSAATDSPAVGISGIHCPTCKGRRLAALYTRHRGAATVRVRQCTACGHKLRTVERVQSARA